MRIKKNVVNYNPFITQKVVHKYTLLGIFFLCSFFNLILLHCVLTIITHIQFHTFSIWFSSSSSSNEHKQFLCLYLGLNVGNAQTLKRARQWESSLRSYSTTCVYVLMRNVDVDVNVNVNVASIFVYVPYTRMLLLLLNIILNNAALLCGAMRLQLQTQTHPKYSERVRARGNEWNVKECGMSKTERAKENPMNVTRQSSSRWSESCRRKE